MIDNGGFVLAIEYLNPSSVVFGQWIPVTLLEVSPQAVTVTEGSGTGVPYTVALSTTPSGPVTVTVNVPSGNLVTAVPGALTYSTTNWNTAQTVTVTATSAANDADGADAEVTLTHTAAAGSGNTFTFAARTADNVTVTIADDETPAIVVSESSLTVTEGTSPTATYTVALGAQPTGGVKVQVNRGDPGYLLNKVGGTQATSQTLTLRLAAFSARSWFPRAVPAWPPSFPRAVSAWLTWFLRGAAHAPALAPGSPTA